MDKRYDLGEAAFSVVFHSTQISMLLWSWYFSNKYVVPHFKKQIDANPKKKNASFSGCVVPSLDFVVTLITGYGIYLRICDAIPSWPDYRHGFFEVMEKHQKSGLSGLQAWDKAASEYIRGDYPPYRHPFHYTKHFLTTLATCKDLGLLTYLYMMLGMPSLVVGAGHMCYDNSSFFKRERLSEQCFSNQSKSESESEGCPPRPR